MVGGKCGKKLQKQVAFDKTTCFCWKVRRELILRQFVATP